uniref:Protein Wnt n=1 Tax=Ficedula albicollis TaxID=59894 RepID=A0A803VSD5_FICAL
MPARFLGCPEHQEATKWLKSVLADTPHTHTAAQTSHTLSTASISDTLHQYSQLSDILHQSSQLSDILHQYSSYLVFHTSTPSASFHLFHWKQSSSCPAPAGLPSPSCLSASIHSCSPGEAREASSPTASSSGKFPKDQVLIRRDWSRAESLIAPLYSALSSFIPQNFPWMPLGVSPWGGTRREQTHLFVLQVLSDSLDTRCKCHGVSGSCSVKTCWKGLPDLGEIASDLKSRYLAALKVTHRLVGPRKQLIPKEGDARPVTEMDLVYLINSPDYCTPNPQLGSLGTQDRPCNRSSVGSGSCDLLCCGRGYNTYTEEVQERCHCRYRWCCSVVCRRCRRRLQRHVCK